MCLNARLYVNQHFGSPVIADPQRPMGCNKTPRHFLWKYIYCIYLSPKMHPGQMTFEDMKEEKKKSNIISDWLNCASHDFDWWQGNVLSNSLVKGSTGCLKSLCVYRRPCWWGQFKNYIWVSHLCFCVVPSSVHPAIPAVTRLERHAWSFLAQSKRSMVLRKAKQKHSRFVLFDFQRCISRRIK